jgi:cytochrome c oxidase subunit I+III
MMSERLGCWSFGVMFVGFHVAFFPMHLLGLQGMPRRVYTYPADMGWEQLNLTATVGALLFAFGVLLTLVNAFRSVRAGAIAAADPWGGGTLEWATASPPRICNFAAVPVVHGRDPVWQPTPHGEPDHVQGLAADAREHLVTTLVDARPDSRMLFPESTPWPFLAAVATTVLFVSSVFTPWAVVWASIPVVAALVMWFWPSHHEAAEELALEKSP